jgi:L-threonylcarbamoyladenylate synthase
MAMLDVIKCVRNGGVVVFPTDTLFALSCDATNDFAVKRVFEIKGREFNKPLPIFVSGIEMASEYIEMNDDARSLAKEFWPGKLTILGKSKAGVKLSKAINNGTDTIAVRVPECMVALEIVKALNVPLVGTSANISGDDNLSSIELIKEKFGNQVDYYLEGAIKSNAMPSTIVNVTSGKIEIARNGAISVDQISKILL